MPNSSEAWMSLNGISPVPTRIQALSPHAAKTAFLTRFYELNGELAGSTHSTSAKKLALDAA